MSKKLKLDESILFMAFRYALGRATYVVSEVVETIIEQWNFLSNQFKELVIKEIKQELSSNDTMMGMDVREWTKILNLPVESLKEVTIYIPFTYTLGEEGYHSGIVLNTIEDCMTEVRAEVESGTLTENELFLELKE